ncbi:histone RNA hairpin-binding protein-like isoform X2 [Physella acuta]|uniref:histone RNA hairpin-binding protein-like isoform X2 n=1 Tax=Physella acuta TaxID=109671 RepID=UPI0027DC6E0A|nr:histone RNA hairpin-binding protein-like isoform X2 [Physella acuta]
MELDLTDEPMNIGSWADITDDTYPYNESENSENETDTRSKLKLTNTTRSKPTDLTSNQPLGFNTKNTTNSFEGAKTDLRNKLNKNRKESYQQRNHSPYSKRRSEAQTTRPNYTTKLGGLSPLRSPISRDRNSSVANMDNSHSHRYTRRYDRTHQASPHSKNGNCNQQSPIQHRDTSLAAKDLVSGNDETSPKTVLPHSEEEESRRRLHLPSENDDSGEESKARLSAVKEEDPLRLARREKDILYGKTTDAYKKYVSTIPKNLRSGDLKLHPRTPEKTRKCSRRSWDSQVKIWKRRLHSWAGLHCKQTDSDLLSSTNNVPSDVASGASSNKSDDDNIDLGDEDDFLDSIDISFQVAEQIEDTIKLNDN